MACCSTTGTDAFRLNALSSNRGALEYTISLPPGGTAFIIGSSTLHLYSAYTSNNPPAPYLLTLGSSVISANAASAFDIDGQTFTPDDAITISDTLYSLLSGGTGIVIHSSTYSFSKYDFTLTGDSAGDLVLDSQTLIPGEITTVDGTVVLMASSGGIAIVGGQTKTLVTSTEAGGIGGYVWSALGGTTEGGGGAASTAVGYTIATAGSFKVDIDGQKAAMAMVFGNLMIIAVHVW